MSKKKDDGFKTIGTQITKENHAKLQKLKTTKKQSISCIVNEAITKYFEESK